MLRKQSVAGYWTIFSAKIPLNCALKLLRPVSRLGTNTLRNLHFNAPLSVSLQFDNFTLSLSRDSYSVAQTDALLLPKASESWVLATRGVYCRSQETKDAERTWPAGLRVNGSGTITLLCASVGGPLRRGFRPGRAFGKGATVASGSCPCTGPTYRLALFGALRLFLQDGAPSRNANLEVGQSFPGSSVREEPKHPLGRNCGELRNSWDDAG
ncbi:unnamed protein product [Symbiodinium sp. CCMP2456]|nr:unnamed protein product [Symbiodinium sp. CCMP2456]